jgi:hypothetical protein
MKATVGLTLGKVGYTFEIEEKTELDTLHKIAVLGNPPTFCEECTNDKPEQFKLTSNKDSEGNTYVNVECNVCTAKAKLGLYKSGGYFWKKFEKYVKKTA